MEDAVTIHSGVHPYPSQIKTVLGTFCYDPVTRPEPRSSIQGTWRWMGFELCYHGETGPTRHCPDTRILWSLSRRGEFLVSCFGTPEECVELYVLSKNPAMGFAHELLFRLSRLCRSGNAVETRKRLAALIEVTVAADKEQNSDLVVRAGTLELGLLGVLNGLLVDSEHFVAACYDDATGELTEFSLVPKKRVLVQEPPGDKSPDAQ